MSLRFLSHLPYSLTGASWDCLSNSVLAPISFSASASGKLGQALLRNDVSSLPTPSPDPIPEVIYLSLWPLCDMIPIAVKAHLLWGRAGTQAPLAPGVRHWLPCRETHMGTFCFLGDWGRNYCMLLLLFFFIIIIFFFGEAFEDDVRADQDQGRIGRQELPR